MKHHMRLIIIFLSLLSLALCACSQGGSNQPVQPAEKEKTFEMKDILWTVEESILEGERVLTLDYTNNSPYSILSLEITFTEREDLTPEEREEFFTSIKREYTSFWSFWDDDDEEDLNQLKSLPLTIKAGTERMAKSGESIHSIPCYYYDGWFEVKRITQYEKTEADIASIRYVRDGTIFTCYYDFHSGKITTEEKTEPAYYWTSGPLADKLPKPDTEVVTKDYGNEQSYFSFEAYGFSQDMFADYIKLCREMGYSNDISEWDGYYSAKNSEGYGIHMSWDEEDYIMDAGVYSPDYYS